MEEHDLEILDRVTKGEFWKRLFPPVFPALTEATPRARVEMLTQTLVCQCQLRIEAHEGAQLVRAIWPCLEHSALGIWDISTNRNGARFIELDAWDKAHQAGPEVPAKGGP